MPYGSPSKAETRPASSCTGKYLKRYTWLETSGRRTCFLRIGHIVNSVILVIRIAAARALPVPILSGLQGASMMNYFFLKFFHNVPKERVRMRFYGHKYLSHT